MELYKTIKDLRSNGYAHIERVGGMDGKAIYYAYIYMPTMDSGHPTSSSQPNHYYRRVKGLYRRMFWDGVEYVPLILA